MKWTYSLTDDNDAEIYDHKDELVTLAYNSDIGIQSRNGIPIDPDVKEAICDYICEEIDADDFPNDEEMRQYVETAQTVLAAENIEERDE